MFSYAFLPLLRGRSAKETTLVAGDAVDECGRAGEMGDVKLDVCDRFTFFVGGSASAATGVLMEGR